MDPVSPDSIGRFLTTSDAAEVLNISVDEVRELIVSSELPAIRTGSPRRWRIERIALEDYIDAQYEETRRMSLWHQADSASVADIMEAVGRSGRP